MTTSEFERRLANAIDESSLKALTTLYQSADNAERAEMRSRWNFGVNWVYPNPYALAQSILDEPPCHDRIRTLLIVDSIDERAWELDPRDVIIGFANIWAAAEDTGMNPAALFEEVAAMSSPNIAKGMRDFAARPPAEKVLENFQLTRTQTPTGIRCDRM